MIKSYVFSVCVAVALAGCGTPTASSGIGASGQKAGQADVVQQHRTTALEHAEKQLRFTDALGLPQTTIRSVQMEPSGTVAVDGLAGHYRTVGTAHLTRYDRNNRALPPVTRAFEVTTQQKGDGQIEVVGFAAR